MGLDIDMVGAEELFGPLYGELLDYVDILAAAVVALSGVAFGVLVGHHASGRFHHLFADEVLGGDELELVLLPFGLEPYGLKHFIVEFFSNDIFTASVQKYK